MGTSLLRRAWFANRPLVIFAAAMVALVPVAMAGLALDERQLVGAPIWAKPLKFAVSLAVYSATFAVLLSLLPRPSRAGWWAGTVTAVAGAVEMAVIVGQVARGRRSHFNMATPLDSVLFNMMGATIVVLWVAGLVLAVILLRGRGPATVPAPLMRSIRLGVIISLIGLGLGSLMLIPAPGQLAAGGPPTVIGAHSVGVPDGGPGLPLVNWSTTGGDLRIPHFIGMHALQVLPLVALALLRAGRRVAALGDGRVQSRLVAVAAAGYTALLALVTWQALRGQPLTAPDGLTLAALAAIVVGAALGTATALREARTPPAPAEPVLVLSRSSS